MLNPLDKTFKEITGDRLNNTSQLKLFNVLYDSKNKEKILNIFKTYTLNEDTVKNVYFDMYEVDNGDWWDNISYKYYSTPYLWWIIALINDVVDPFEYLENGMFLKILKPEYIYQVLKEIKNISEL